MKHIFITLTSASILFSVVPTCLACCGVGTRQQVLYQFSTDLFSPSKPYLSNQWTISTRIPTTYTTLPDIITPTSSSTQQAATSTAIIVPSSSSDALSSTSTTTSPPVTAGIFRDNCTEEQSKEKECIHGICYAMEVHYNGSVYGREHLCECDSLFTGPQCDVPKTDREAVISSFASWGRVGLTPLVSALITGITVLIVCIILGVIVFIAYFSSYSSLVCCRTQQQNHKSGNVASQASTSQQVQEQERLSEEGAVRRRRYMPQGNEQIAESVEMQPCTPIRNLGPVHAVHPSPASDDNSPMSVLDSDRRGLISAHSKGAHNPVYGSPTCVLGGNVPVESSSSASPHIATLV